MTARKMLSKLKSLTFVEETTFGTDPGSQARLRLAQEIAFKPGLNMLEVGAQKSEADRGPDPHIPDAQFGALSFKVPLFTVSGSSSPLITLAKRLGMVLRQVTAGTEKITGGTSSTFTMDDADAASSGLDAGDADNIGKAVMHIPASGTNSVRFVTRIVSSEGTTTVTVNQDFSTTPSDGDSVGAMDTIIAQSGPAAKSLNFTAYEGHGDTNCLEWDIGGCAGSWKLESLGPKAMAMMAFEMTADRWAASEASIAQSAASGNDPRSVRGATLLVDGSALIARSLSFDPGINFIPVGDVGGTNGIQDWVYLEQNPKLEIECLHDTAWMTRWAAGTTVDLLLQDLASSTDAWALWAPAVQTIDYEETDLDGIVGAKPGLLLSDPEKNADSYNLPQYAFAMSA